MCPRVFSNNPFIIIYCPGRYKTLKMCDESVDDCLAALKFIPDWFVPNKMLEKFHDDLPANDDILFFNEDFNKITIFVNQMDILAVDLYEIKLEEGNNFDNMVLILLFVLDFWLEGVNLKNTKHLKKGKQKVNTCNLAS